MTKKIISTMLILIMLYITAIPSIASNLTELQEQKEEAENKKEEVTKEKESVLDEISELNSQITQYENEIERLNNDIGIQISNAVKEIAKLTPNATNDRITLIALSQ